MSAVRQEIERMAELYGGPDVSQLRVPPHSTEAEQAVLGGLMLSPAALWGVQDVLAQGDFYRRDHQRIYAGILELSEKRKPYDAVTLGDWFEARGESDLIAGGDYLIELATSTASAANIRAWAEIVRDKALQRRLIDVGTEIVNAGFDGRCDSGDALASAQTLVQGLMPKQRGGLSLAADSLKDYYQDLQARYDSEGRLTGMPTPWGDFNKHTHGLQPGELALFAARPSMGKSILGLNLSLFASLREKRVALFSLEMSKRQIHRRNIASLMKVPHDWLLAPSKEGDDYWPQVTEGIRQLKASNLYVDDTADLTINQVMARARNQHLQEPIDLLVVDHIHDFKVDAKLARFEYGKIAQGLKTLAKEFNCPVVALAQLNRQMANRADKRPTMTDLRESGELEQKADLIVFLHREDYYDKESYMRGAVELIVAKGRDIEAGKTILLRNDYAHMALRDWEGPAPQPPVQSSPNRSTGRGFFRSGKSLAAGGDE
ncbi:replicative DNA helicase [Pseudoxanthomonas sp. X-1]|uniref:replicative DNA helicase n=1 Tax=Pseudoxanthomonas sp. X-1 TaxID=2571115 RepID=UPI001CC5D925|nr:replicative DNA helicase [Pseudoxanthomonas sp. X-1]